jgi:hypothetical protein
MVKLFVLDFFFSICDCAILFTFLLLELIVVECKTGSGIGSGTTMGKG